MNNNKLRKYKIKKFWRALVRFKNGKIVDTYGTLIDPEDNFSFMNISIHGITEKHVKNAPVFPEAYKKVSEFLEGQIVVSHTHFDRSVLNKTIARYRIVT